MDAIYLSPDAFARRTDEASIAEQMGDVFAAAGMPRATPADNDRVGGWMLMYQMLDAGEWAITENCGELIRVLPTLVRDTARVEDVEKMDGDDAADAARLWFEDALFGPAEQNDSRSDGAADCGTCDGGRSNDASDSGASSEDCGDEEGDASEFFATTTVERRAMKTREIVQRIRSIWNAGSATEEVARLRAENRALMNSILGIAGVPPVIVGSEARAAAGPGAAVRGGAGGSASGAAAGAAGAAKRNASMAMRRRSWHQVNRMLEIDAARKKDAGKQAEAVGDEGRR